MATEKSREISVRKISIDGKSEAFVYLKIIDKITFVDPSEQYQEYEFSFDNSSTLMRSVDIEEVGDEKLKVERIKNLNILLPQDQYQQYIYTLLTDPKAHKKTHKKKIYAFDKDKNKKDESTWIEVERVDEISYLDPQSQYQETVFTLSWRDDGEFDYENLSPIITEYDAGIINPPWRIDPFQNIVDCQLSDKCVAVFHSGNKISFAPMSYLKDNSGKINHKSLAAGNWGNDYLPTSQINQGIFVPITGFVTGNLSQSDNYVVTTNKLAGEHVSDRKISKYEYPVMNSETIKTNKDTNKTTVWITEATVYFGSNGKIENISNFPPITGNLIDDGDITCFAIDEKGTRYSGDRFFFTTLHASPLNRDKLTNDIAFRASTTRSPPPTDDLSVIDVAYYRDGALVVRPHEFVSDYTFDFQGDGIDGDWESGWWNRYNLISYSGGYIASSFNKGIVSIETVDYSIHAEYSSYIYYYKDHPVEGFYYGIAFNNGVPYTTKLPIYKYYRRRYKRNHNTTIISSLGGIFNYSDGESSSWDITYEGSAPPEPDYQIISKSIDLQACHFPPNISGLPPYAVAVHGVYGQYRVPSYTDVEISTPYGRFHAKPPDTPFVYPDVYINGWLHISSKYHILQSFYIEDEPHMYLDMNKINSLLGVPVSEIQTVLFDIPSSKIRSFK